MRRQHEVREFYKLKLIMTTRKKARFARVAGIESAIPWVSINPIDQSDTLNPAPEVPFPNPDSTYCHIIS